MTHFRKKISSALISVALTAALVLFLVFPARYAASVKEGIMLWAASVLPATLPFLFLIALFTRRKFFSRLAKCFSPLSRALFAVSGSGACCMLLSAVSGYPVGARTVLDLTASGRLAKDERFRTAILSTTTGPAFLVGAVGFGMFHSAAAGWLLFGAHLIGVYLVGFFLRLHTKIMPAPSQISEAPPISLSQALSDSVLSVLCVGGAIAIFYAFGAMIADIGALCSLPETANTVIRGLLEMTSGCALVAQAPSAFSLALCAFFVTFGGLCVLVQQLAFLLPAGISTPRFLLAKLAQGLIAGLFAFLFAVAAGF